MAGRPPDRELALSALARCHLLCLPRTASSRAGLDVLESLYGALGKDDAARVIWDSGPADAPHWGAFASGTVRYRDTERLTQRSLPKLAFARLALRVAAMPQHVLARRRWEALIPHEAIGYVLTLGASSAVVKGSSTRRGRELLAELERFFVERGSRESFTDTELSNERAHAFYVRNGYVEVSRDFGQVLLRKPLAGV